MKTKPYRNKFEKSTAEVLKGLCEYEPEKIPYTVFRNYVPDFVGKDKTGKKVLVEAKGFFRVGDVQKYMNMSEWCTKEGFRWFTVEDVVNAFTS